MLKLIKSNQKNFLHKLNLILEQRKFKNTNIEGKIKSIINDVKKNKDLALVKYERKYSTHKNISLKKIKFSILEKKKNNKKIR